MKKKILLAEDDQPIVEVVKIILQNEGYEVLIADHASDVHKIIERDHLDMIILDIWLFGEDGGKIAKDVKTRFESRDIPLILMSANSETEKIAQSVGADDFLLKPFNIEDLLYIVRKYIKS